MTSVRSKNFGWVYGVITIVAVVYLPAVFNDFVEWDDTLILVHNPFFNPPTWHTVAHYWTHITYNLYQPMTCTLWAALAKMAYVATADQFGSHMNPYLFHLASVLLHAISAGLLFVILNRIFRSSIAAALGALAFAIHPIQVEAIAFIGVMNNPLFGLFSLVSIYNYIKWRDGGRWMFFWIGAISLLCACLAKPTAIVIPPILFVMDFAIFARPWRQALRAILPWVLLTLPCIAWTMAFQKGAGTADSPLSFRPLLAGDVLTLYLWKIFVPVRFCIDYGWNPRFIHARAWGYILWTALAGLLLAGWSFRRKSWVPLASLVMFMIALLPNSGLASFDYQNISNVADRYAYIAMLSVALFIAWIVSRFGRVAVGIVSLVLLVWVVQTESQIQTWRNGEALFRHAMAVNPEGWLAPTNLSFIVRGRDAGEAESLCRLAIANAPEAPLPKNALASLLATTRPDESIALSRQVLRMQPGNVEAYNNLGAALWAKGESELAIEAFGKAIKIDPENAVYRKNFVAAGQAGNPVGSDSSYRTSQAKPTSQSASTTAPTR